MSSEAASPHIVVVGGGLTGLTAAHRLLELRPDVRVTLLEASGRLGGVLETSHRDGFLVEHSADNFITDTPWAIDLCRRIGLEDDLLPTNTARRRAFVVKYGQLYPVPDGFLLMAPGKVFPIARSRLLTFAGKMRLVKERFVPPRAADAAEESLAEFATRRLGQEAYEWIVQPLVAGIYSADPEKLSVAATLPRFLEMERRHGSLTQAALNKRRDARQDPNSSGEAGARYGMFLALRDGMGTLVDALVAKLSNVSIQKNTPVKSITRDTASKWQIETSTADSLLVADGLIVTTSATVTAGLVESVEANMADRLRKIPYGGCSVVVLGLREKDIGRPVKGFGFVVPAVEERPILAASFSSNKFPGRAPKGHVLARVFIGGAGNEHLMELPDDELEQIAIEQLTELMELRGEPIFAQVARWNGAMPQYHVGHVELVDEIEQLAAELPGFALAGSAYRGVGIPHCIHGAEKAAERVLKALGKDG